MPDLFLIAPPDADPPAIAGLIGASGARALLLPRRDATAAGYAARVEAVLPLAQPRDVAVLIEGTPDDVRRLGADGLHVAGNLAATRAAVAALKPDFIVGAVAESRHDAMDKAEAGVDYVFFGPLSGPIDARTRDLAHWWAETMEVPAVFSDPEAGPDDGAEGCEFLAPGTAAWRSRT